MIKELTLFILGVGVLDAAPVKKDSAYKIVTKKVSLGQFVPDDIVTFMGTKMSKRIVPDLKRLIRAAQKDGLNLRPISGYRSYEYQVKLFNRYVRSEMKKHPELTRSRAEQRANSFSAKPGHSEHQLGTTIDLLSKENNFRFSSDPSLKYVGWLEKNAGRFNFKISYPKDSKEYMYEPWHIRWYPRK